MGETELGEGGRLSGYESTLKRTVSGMSRSARDGVLRQPRGDVGDHVAKFAASGELLAVDVHAVFGEHAVHRGEHAGDVDVQVRNAVRSGRSVDREIRQVHAQPR